MDWFPPPNSVGSDTDRLLKEQQNIELQASLLKQQRRARFSFNKLSPVKLTARSIGKGDYQAYSKYANILPYPERLEKLESTSKAEKLSYLISGKSGALHSEQALVNS